MKTLHDLTEVEEYLLKHDPVCHFLIDESDCECISIREYYEDFQAELMQEYWDDKRTNEIIDLELGN